MANRCQHDNIETRSAGEALINDTTGETIGVHVKLQVRCAQCLMPFAFTGLPLTQQTIDKPTMGAYGHEARLPVIPAPTNPSWDEIDRVIEEATAAPPAVVPEVKN